MSRQNLMPQAPKQVGAYHTKEQALQRVQQQFGLYKNYNKPSSLYKRGSMSNIDEAAAPTAASNDIVSSTKENNALLLNFEQDLNDEKQFTGSNIFSGMASLTDNQPQQQQQHMIYNSNKKLNTQQLIATSPSSSTCNYCHMHDFPIQQQQQQQQQKQTCNKNNLLTDVNGTLTNAVDDINLHDFDIAW